MTDAQKITNLTVPGRLVDAVLDTDTYNEIDDQFALAYFLSAPERIRPLAIYAAPFYNRRSNGPADGMERSYAEIGRILPLMGRTDIPYFRGADAYLPSETEPVDSPAARDLVRLAREHNPADPLYVVAIGAITNVASALLLAPEIKDNIVVIWLGGQGLEFTDTTEFNMVQDVAAARVVFASGAPLVQLPCRGVVEAFSISGPELRYWLVDKNPLADYLARATLDYMQEREGTPWTKPLWDVAAVAWLLNDGDRFMHTRLIPTPMPEYSGHYGQTPKAPLMRYAYQIRRDALMTDLFRRLLTRGAS